MRRDSTLVAQAMGLRDPKQAAQAGATPSQTTAVMRPTTAGRFQALLVDAVDLAAMISYPWYHRDPAEARRRMRERLVMSDQDPTQPHVVDVMLEARDDTSRHWMIRAIAEGDRTKLVSAKWPLKAIYGSALVPDPTQRGSLIQAEVVPHAVMDAMGGMIPYMQMSSQGIYECAGNMTCILFRPEPRKGQKDANGPLRFVPLGLCREYLLDGWNDLVERAASQGASQNFQKIEKIPNALRRSTPFAFLRPLGLPWMGMYKDKDRLDKALKAVNEGKGHIPRPDYEVAQFAFGKVVRKHDKSQNPTVYQLEGGAKGCVECVWRVVETERAVELVYLGERGKLKDIGARVHQVETLELDGFAALALNPQTAMPGRMLVDRGRTLLMAPYDAANPLYIQGLEIGMVMPDDDPSSKHACLETLALRAIAMVENELVEIANQWLGRVSTPGLLDRPTLAQILGEMTPEALKAKVNQKHGECVLATWIGAQIAEDNQFNWKSWVMKKVRRELLLTMARAEGLSIPAKDDKPAGDPPKDSEPEGAGNGKPEAKPEGGA